MTDMMRRFLLRLPGELYAAVKAAAERERRSLHAEILCLLERALAPEAGVPGAVVTSHESRPGRPVLVIGELSDLRGPAGGKVVLPSRLYPEPAGAVFDLDEPSLLHEAYQVVLTEAIGAWELATWLNAARLVQAWPGLYLPDGVRQAWEEIHPVLSSAAGPGA
jgi:hypothetical protein